MRKRASLFDCYGVALSDLPVVRENLGYRLRCPRNVSRLNAIDNDKTAA